MERRLEDLTIDEMRPLPHGSSGWGLFDTKAALWIGNGEFPLVYGHKAVAQLASQITDIQLKQREGQTQAKFFIFSEMREVSRHDTCCSGGEAIARLEQGA